MPKNRAIQQEHGKGWSIWEIGATKRKPEGRDATHPHVLGRLPLQLFMLLKDPKGMSLA